MRPESDEMSEKFHLYNWILDQVSRANSGPIGL